MKFLKLSVDEGDCELKEVRIRQYVNSDVANARFKTSDPALNRIFDAAIETHKQNAVDVFMDCPSRERAGWLCDSYFSARVAYNLSGNTLIEHNYLENFLLPEKFSNIPEGMLPMCYPSDHTNGNFIPNWAMWFVLELDEYVARSGDYEMLISLKPKVMNLLKYFEPFKNEDGLLEKLDKWVFVEWSKANDFVQDVNYPSNMLYARVLEVAGRLYNIPELQTEAEKIREVIRRQSYVNGFFTDNAIRENGKLVVQVKNQTEVCQYFAFYFGVATSKQYPELWQKLAKEFGAKRATTKAYPNIYPANAFVGNYIRLELLSEEGLISDLVTECKDQFTHMADMTGTLWENTFPGSSCCHGFASHVAYVFYRDIAGFSKIDQVNKKISIQFNETGLTSCEASFPVGNDLVSVKWTIKGKTLIYNLKVPDNYTVEVVNKTRYNCISTI
jgi:alpha-L-rhamnosidase